MLVPWVEGIAVASSQDHEQATFTKKIDKTHGELDLSADGYKNYLKFCAYENSVGTFFFVEKNGKKIRVKIKDAEFKDAAFTPLRVVPEGGKEMEYADFLRGFKQ
jgi:methionyl-tRNA formyltransferase